MEDANTGRRFLVDSGLQRSVLRYMTVCFNGWQFGWDWQFGWVWLGPVPFALANVLSSGDVYQQLLSEFPALTVPTFSAEIAKHGVASSRLARWFLRRLSGWMPLSWL